MPEPIHFHSDLYRREALQSAAQKFAGKARIELAESNGHIVARLDPLAPMSDAEARELLNEFCTEALSLTVRRLREAGVPENPVPASVESALSAFPGGGDTLEEVLAGDEFGRHHVGAWVGKVRA